MANFHSRSNSFPSQSHPTIESVEDHLCSLRADNSESTSVCSKLASLKNLHEGINDLIQMPSIQQTLSHENWINELLDGSLKLVDLCALSREIVSLTKESVQDLESSIRRNKAETATSADVSAYVASRKKITKMVNKSIKNLKSFNKSTTDNDLLTMLKEAESHDLSVLKSVLILLSGENEKSSKTSWSLLSKFTTQNSRVHSESVAEDLSSLNIEKSTKNTDSKNMLKQLKSSEMTIQEIEEGLEALFRSLVKTRVSLLNVLSH
ncbi:hypothetical protein ABFS82_03G078800 [Erythranthe guttata]|uniref:DUF241 domain-containing protein n=1 Tax=Erythranthe guttata TaxID=4155 RepID=A0A022PQ16_ERYGU|nr:PREDICTED: uncharacterized protein LOC105950663 [Erythranthe guttata]EYU17529.1 hypothetical protein MIMGU_mgv1a022975mg [Erythranthe guttata]|eukprot:XP_012829484.1 PREDICTED: uncharacterized protein LOC105950663 [Erythranthe guttata]